jgi:hypothetical protein
MSRGMDIIDEVLAEHFGDAFVPEESQPKGRPPDEDNDSPYGRLTTR